MHACIYFSENCADVGRMKLYKLLFLLDFEHYRDLGRSVTGLDYEAWKMGPVPADFDREWRGGIGGDLSVGLKAETITRKFDYDKEESEGYETEKLVARIPFEERLFSPREMKLMASLAKQHFNVPATAMSSQSHAAFGFWDEIWNQRNQPNGPIPYELVFDQQNTERDQLMRDYAAEKQQYSKLSD